ncbi:MAG: OmpA family protein [Alphaproteobacteria bacterium]|nr:MAG: OmpA family protein [Alphaproteobacteria bacterium]
MTSPTSPRFTKSIGKGAAVLALATSMAACTTLDPYTGQQKTSNATKGAIGGALAGAVLGALTNTSDGKQAAKNAMIGAGIGALAGGAIGNYMDQQEMLLRQELEGTGVSVTRVGDSIMLNMPGNITFATDSSDINADFYRVLNSVGVVLNKFDKTYVDVMGHTDSTGSDAYNQGLSERRASSVAQYLASQRVMPQRLIVRGYGEMRPIASNDTDAGRQQNRRVEVQISPFTG